MRETYILRTSNGGDDGREKVDDLCGEGGRTSDEASLRVDGAGRVLVTRSSVDEQNAGESEDGKGEEGDHVAELKRKWVGRESRNENEEGRKEAERARRKGFVGCQGGGLHFSIN